MCTVNNNRAEVEETLLILNSVSVLKGASVLVQSQACMSGGCCGGKKTPEVLSAFILLPENVEKRMRNVFYQAAEI